MGLFHGHHHYCGAAVDDATRVSRSDRAALAEGRAQFCQAFHRGLGAPVIVFGEHFAGHFAPRTLQRNRHQLFLQPALFVGGIGGLLRAKRELILHLAGDALLFAIEFSGIGHVEAAVGVEESDHEGIFELASRSEREAVAAANDEGRLRHGFHAAREDDFCFVSLHHLSGVNDGLHARAAQPVDGKGGGFDRDAGAQTHVPGSVQGVA